MTRRLFIAGLALQMGLCSDVQGQTDSTSHRASLASTALGQAYNLLIAWAARKDETTSLLRGGKEANRWSIATTAAGIYPALVIAAWLTDLPLYDGLLRETLRDEAMFTSRLGALPDDYDLSKRRFVDASMNKSRIIENSARYAESLLAIAAVTGPSPWADRMRSIVDATFLQAAVRTDYAEGPLPSNKASVNGRLLKVLTVLEHATGDDGYLYYARRIGDAYCVGILPKNGSLPPEEYDFSDDRPRRSELFLDDGGVAIIEGLVRLYAAEVEEGTTRAGIYRPIIASMFDAIFANGLTSSGRISRRIDPDGRGAYNVDRRRPSNHEAEVLASAVRFGRLSGNPTYVENARGHASRLDLQEAGDVELSEVAELADLLQSPDLARQVERAIAQRIENPVRRHDEPTQAARLTLLTQTAISLTSGVRFHPWRRKLTWSTSLSGDTLTVVAQDISGTEGSVYLPPDSPFTQFPFAVANDSVYEIRVDGSPGVAYWQGAHLVGSLPVGFPQNHPLRFTVSTQKSAN